MIIIEPRFDYAGPFSEGLATVLSDGNYGYINKKGHFEVPPRFTYADEFNEGLALVGVPYQKLHPAINPEIL